MGGQTDAMKTYRENQMKIGAGGGFKPMSPTEAATYSKFGIKENPAEILSGAAKMVNPNYSRDVSAPSVGEMKNK
jgi:hypothetical protein